MTSQIIIVPSIDDINTLGFYPQEPHQFNLDNDRIRFISNPSMFYINDMLFAVSTFDNLLNLGTSELQGENLEIQPHIEDQCSELLFERDRIQRFCLHLVHQKSFLPVFPVKDPVIFEDCKAFDMNISPDFYVTSSKFKEFERSAALTHVINLGSQSLIFSKKYLSLSFDHINFVDDESTSCFQEAAKVEFKDLVQKKN
ncbi:hypothetical protein EDEG_02660 [Edhazardia aedis USNM 41457]|uniref:DNA polymerase alpha subunit B n=1 Tax=Edhazardia aedis (strain USNM 41457) TaxID=1003232 RepID=J9D5Y4_EDHAE|nr:hypothetical protein EDEG_02660 [Edhazardia aedis USNM 41457]|eukprot:EJW02954.1 hypothetical protein EDEG_02660 [Edhazardia aedis USNM 41457]